MHYTIRDHRHTFAVTAAKQGMPIPQIAVQLGHTDIKVTMRYAKYHPEFMPHPIQAGRTPVTLKSGATMSNGNAPAGWYQLGCLTPNRRPSPNFQKEGSPGGDWYCTKLSTAKVRLTAYHSRIDASNRPPLSSSETSLLTFP